MAKEYYAKRTGFEWELLGKFSHMIDALEKGDHVRKAGESPAKAYKSETEVMALGTRKADALERLEQLKKEASRERAIQAEMGSDPTYPIKNLVRGCVERHQEALDAYRHAVSCAGRITDGIERYAIEIAAAEEEKRLCDDLRAAMKDGFDKVKAFSESTTKHFTNPFVVRDQLLPRNPIHSALKAAAFQAGASFAAELKEAVVVSEGNIKVIERFKAERA